MEEDQGRVQSLKTWWNSRAHFPPGTLRAAVRHLQAWCARLSTRVRKNDGARDWRIAHAVGIAESVTPKLASAFRALLECEQLPFVTSCDLCLPVISVCAAGTQVNKKLIKKQTATGRAVSHRSKQTLGKWQEQIEVTTAENRHEKSEGWFTNCAVEWVFHGAERSFLFLTERGKELGVLVGIERRSSGQNAE